MMRFWAMVAAAMLAFVGLAGAARAGDVGFQEVQVANGTDTPLRVGIWYPTRSPVAPTPLETFTQTVAPGGEAVGHGLPLIVMSHGNGGWYGEHVDTSLALAQAGFVVAAVSHTGDTYNDQSRAIRISARPAQIKRLIDYMTGEWAEHGRINPRRIGMFGFSSGGFTTLVAIGGVPDLSMIPAHCRAHPHYFDCNLIRSAPAGAQVDLSKPVGDVWVHDARIRAAVVAAPALGFTFSHGGLAGVSIPVQLWRDANDHILPHPDYAESVRLNLPAPPEYHVVPGADHFDFLAPCSDILAKVAPTICVSAPGFDRAAFHRDFDRQVVAFFERTLG
jgi:predicted dienelactone hydrolase